MDSAWLPRSAWGIGVVSIVVLLGANRNLLYLTMLLCAYGLWAVTGGARWTTAVGVALLTVLAATRVAVPEVEFHDVGMAVKGMPPGESVSCAFQVTPIPGVEGWDSLPAELVIDGRALSDLDVVVNERRPTPGDYRPKYWFEQMRIPLGRIGAREVLVTLRARERGAPELYLGPEVRGSVAYPEAVFIEVANERVTVVYHAACNRRTADRPR